LKLDKFDSPNKKTSDKKNKLIDLGQKSAFSSSKINNPLYNMITPEKSKNIPKEKNRRKFNDEQLRSVSFMNTNTNTTIPFSSTHDKTKR
jgi:hypothetical protein